MHCSEENYPSIASHVMILLLMESQKRKIPLVISQWMVVDLCVCIHGHDTTLEDCFHVMMMMMMIMMTILLLMR